MIQEGVTARAKAPQQDQAWHIGGTARRSVWLEEVKAGMGPGQVMQGPCEPQEGLGLLPRGRW